MQIETAELVVPCKELDKTLPFFTDQLGFKILSIFPADDPAIAVIAGHGLRLQLNRKASGDPGTLQLLTRRPNGQDLTAPNGTRIEFVEADPPVAEPPPQYSLAVQKMAGEASWGVGRAGMLYRDLVPDRQGGSIIASHIRIPDAGPVPDYVHFHKIRFQLIYCYKGWVRLVYEDQGAPFVLSAGDCVLQPPEIRHRVLESSGGLEVIEVGCPAEHMTCVDHDMALPTPKLDPERSFGGQSFVRHEMAKAEWQPWRRSGFEARDLGIGDATAGLAGVQVARVTSAQTPVGFATHNAELLFHFVLEGGLTLRTEDAADQPLSIGDSFMLPPGLRHAFVEPQPDLQLLEVALPARFELGS